MTVVGDDQAFILNGYLTVADAIANSGSIRRLTAGADAVDNQRVFLDPEAVFSGNGALPLLDHGIDELDDFAALDADQMVMVTTAIQFENGLAPFKMAPTNQSGAFKLGQDTIDRRQPDVFIVTEQFAVNTLGAQMALAAVFQNAQDLDPRHRDLESGLFDLLIAQFGLPIARWSGSIHPFQSLLTCAPPVIGSQRCCMMLWFIAKSLSELNRVSSQAMHDSKLKCCHKTTNFTLDAV